MPLTDAQSKLLEEDGVLTKDFDPEFRYLKAVLFGRYGVGKTVTAASLGRTMFLAADPGFVAVYNHPEMAKNIVSKQYRGYQHFNAMTIALQERVGEYGEIDTFVIDTLDEIVADVVDSIVIGFDRGKGDDRPEFVPKPGGVNARQTLPPFDVPGRTDYHAARNLLRGPLRRLMSAPVNVIILTHERDPTEEELKKKDTLREKRPSVTDGVYKTIANHVHCLGWFQREGDVRSLTFEQSKTLAGKSRIASLDGKKIKAEDFPKHIARWQGKPVDHYVTDFRTA